MTRVSRAGRAGPVPVRAAFALLLFPAVGGAAEVAVLKSTEALAWRASLDALKKTAAPHTVTEFDLRGTRAEAERVLAGFKGKGVILVALGLLAAQAAHELAPELPLIFCMVQDPAKAGLAAGPNLTGVSFVVPVKNQLAAFRLVNPHGVRIGVLYNDESVGRQVQEAQKAAPMFRLTVVARPLASDRDVPAALRTLLKGDDAVDAVWMMADPVLLGDEVRRYIMSETFKAGKPVYGFSASLVQEGALVSNGPDYASIGEQAGELVKRLASGDRARLDVLIPRAELVINRKIAEKLHIELHDDAVRAASRTY